MTLYAIGTRAAVLGIIFSAVSCLLYAREAGNQTDCEDMRRFLQLPAYIDAYRERMAELIERYSAASGSIGLFGDTAAQKRIVNVLRGSVDGYRGVLEEFVLLYEKTDVRINVDIHTKPALKVQFDRIQAGHKDLSLYARAGGLIGFLGACAVIAAYGKNAADPWPIYLLAGSLFVTLFGKVLVSAIEDGMRDLQATVDRIDDMEQSTYARIKAIEESRTCADVHFNDFNKAKQ